MKNIIDLINKFGEWFKDLMGLNPKKPSFCLYTCTNDYGCGLRMKVAIPEVEFTHLKAMGHTQYVKRDNQNNLHVFQLSDFVREVVW